MDEKVPPFPPSIPIHQLLPSNHLPPPRLIYPLNHQLTLLPTPTVIGTLKGYDALMNLVLDDVSETLRDDDGNTTTRPLGLVVARGTLLVLVSPMDGSEEIANPFVAQEDE